MAAHGVSVGWQDRNGVVVATWDRLPKRGKIANGRKLKQPIIILYYGVYIL